MEMVCRDCEFEKPTLVFEAVNNGIAPLSCLVNIPHLYESKSFVVFILFEDQKISQGTLDSNSPTGSFCMAGCTCISALKAP